MKIKVLLIDDKPALETVRGYFPKADFDVVYSNNSLQALSLARELMPDVALVSAEMQETSGPELTRLIRKNPFIAKIPIIILAAKSAKDADIVAGLDAGADDYIIKPVSYPVFFARIKAALRRYQACRQMSEKIKKLGIELNPQSRIVKIGGKLITLTRKEFELLTFFLSKAGRVITTSNLLEMVWGYDPARYNNPHTVAVHVSSLRRKLGPKFSKHIVNLHGAGYKFEYI